MNQLEALVAQMHTTGILYSEAVREFKKRFIMNVLQQNKGNQYKAAKELQMHRNTLSRTMGEMGLDIGQFREPKPRSMNRARLQEEQVAMRKRVAPEKDASDAPCAVNLREEIA